MPHVAANPEDVDLSKVEIPAGTPPVVLAGFSFGTYVQTRVAQSVAAERLVLIGPAVQRFASVAVPADTIVIVDSTQRPAPSEMPARAAGQAQQLGIELRLDRTDRHVLGVARLVDVVVVASGPARDHGGG